MFNKLNCFCLAIILAVSTTVSAAVFEINSIEDILPAIEENTLVLFDMDDTLTDSSINLGSGAWRQYIRKKIPEYEKLHGLRWGKRNLHDEFSFYAASKVPVVPVEETLPEVIRILQKRGSTVLVFTARGSAKWYASDMDNVDVVTLMQLRQAGYDFASTPLPCGFEKIPEADFQEGVLFTSGVKKGPFLQNLLKTTGYRPSKIIFIDDKLDQVQSVEKSLKDESIPFTGFWYKCAEASNADFDPVVATLQLSYLMEKGEILSDEAALEMKKSLDDVDGERFFFEFLDRVLSHHFLIAPFGSRDSE